MALLDPVEIEEVAIIEFEAFPGIADGDTAGPEDGKDGLDVAVSEVGGTGESGGDNGHGTRSGRPLKVSYGGRELAVGEKKFQQVEFVGISIGKKNFSWWRSC